ENKELLKELHRLGLKRVLWGVESADDGVLKALNKHLTLEQIDETLAVSHEAGMENFALLMAGMPEEGPEEAKKTRDKVAEWLEKGLVQHFQILPLCLLPGTPLYDRAQKEGWYYQPDPFQFEVTGGTPWLTQGEIADHLWKMREIGKPYGAFM
ncbi:MAG: radical SAM protein, partial [Gammaproteobacteria bacterium]|nr:radical SAM protein [Gammaproteobacteria bacterium]MBU2685690.1 radical SAM protein [Gammaproteobacteria bacterium]